jgi:hypothetical protein
VLETGDLAVHDEEVYPPQTLTAVGAAAAPTPAAVGSEPAAAPTPAAVGSEPAAAPAGESEPSASSSASEP